MLKTHVMEYKVNYNSIKAVVEEEISRVASRSYSNDGVALYDNIRLVSRDEDTLKRFLTEAANVLFSRFRLFISFSSTDISLVILNLPDLPNGFEDQIKNILDRYLSLSIVGRWLQECRNEESAMYIDRANVSINEAELLMMTRMPVKRRER